MDKKEQKVLHEKISRLAQERTREEVQSLLPWFYENTNNGLDEPMTDREELISGMIISLMLKQIILVSIANDDEALEQIAREVEDEMEEE